ncbi:MAG: hypothetical protein K8R40_07730 [Anaerolineaceae bacterium]|nr:hypothetical protein [Anaerolineaceae bacterium]
MDEITNIVFKRIPIVAILIGVILLIISVSNPFIIGKITISISTIYGQIIVGVIGFCLLCLGFFIEIKEYKITSENGNYHLAREKIRLIDDFPKSLVKKFESSNEVWVLGASLSQSIQYLTIEQKLRLGHTIKILIIDPDGKAIEMVERRVYRVQNIKKRIFSNLNVLRQLCDLQKRYPTQIEIKVIDFLLPYRVIALNPSTDKGVLYIHHYSYKPETSKVPKFILNPKNGRWYNFYLEEVKKYWNDGVVWKCRTTSTQE